uniref:Uncharacterized protein n=1 Tax=Tanacetum cinerariifolium TaxID=118510 RepID=A0A6L2LEB5_TANCI|nr:hypothetical protein [Tanacetum cinerariifolium]
MDNAFFEAMLKEKENAVIPTASRRLLILTELDETDQMFENNDTGLENFNDCDDVRVASDVKAPTKITSKGKKRNLEEDDVFISKITSSLDNILSAID